MTLREKAKTSYEIFLLWNEKVDKGKWVRLTEINAELAKKDSEIQNLQRAITDYDSVQVNLRKEIWKLKDDLEQSKKDIREYQNEIKELCNQESINLTFTEEKLASVQKILNEFPGCDSKCDTVKLCSSRICGKVTIWKEQLREVLDMKKLEQTTK